jgi:hypothetical protein
MEAGTSSVQGPPAALSVLIGQIKQKVSTFCKGSPLNFPFLEKMGADPILLKKWKDGWRINVDFECPHHIRNHPSLREHAARVVPEWDRNHELGKFTWFPPDAPKPHKLHVSPCAAILKDRPGADPSASIEDRTKIRIIIDLLRGLVNAHVIDEEVDFATLERALSHLRKDWWLFVLDLSDAFFNWKIHPDDAWLLGVYDEHNRRYGRYDFAPFGLKCAPGINDRSLKEILRLLHTHHGVTFSDWVDDLIAGAPSEAAAWDDLRTSVHFLLECGIPVSCKPTGIRVPAQRQEWVGWVFDTHHLFLAVPDAKREKARDRITSVRAANKSNTLHAKAFLGCVGLLNHIADIVPAGRRKLRSSWDIVNATGISLAWARGSKLDPRVSLTPQAHQDLEWWFRRLRTPITRKIFEKANGFLTTWNPRFPSVQQDISLAHTDPGILIYETDAASTLHWGWTRCADSQVYSGPWPQWVKDMGKKADINFKELWVITHQIIPTEARSWSGRRILVKCDNSAAVAYINKRAGRIPKLNALLSAIEMREETFGFAIASTHLRGIHNVIADLASRDVCFQPRWEQDSTKDLSLRDGPFDRISATLRSQGMLLPFTVDAWDDRHGSTAKAPAWCFPEDTAFAHDFAHEVVWAFPPHALILEWLDKVQLPQARAVVTVAIADPRTFRANVLKRLEARFKLVISFRPDEKIFTRQPTPACLPSPARRSRPGRASSAGHPVWILLWTPKPGVKPVTLAPKPGSSASLERLAHF